jgi:glycosyltransferase involved in cell wall biosynthesis
MSSNPMHLLIAHYRPDIVSGAENSIADLVDLMDERFRVTMLVPAAGKLARFYQDRGFNVWVQEVQTPRRLLPGLHTLQSMQLSSRLKKEGIHAVIGNTLPAASRVSTACKMAGLPLGIYIRDLIKDTPAHRKLLGRASRIFTISKDLAEIASKLTPAEKVNVTYNYIRPEPILTKVNNHRASGDRLLPFSPNHPVVGIIGRITRYKQQDLFIRAIPLILQAVPNTRFVVVGTAQEKEKDYEAAVKQLAQDLSVAEKVSFMGHRTDSIEITTELTVACLTSTREPLGRVILEAQLTGVPLVVSNTGGPAEITVDEESALQFPPLAEDAVERFATQVIRLLQDDCLREMLARNARESVNRTFASESVVRRQETLIADMIQSHRGSQNGR